MARYLLLQASERDVKTTSNINMPRIVVLHPTNEAVLRLGRHWSLNINFQSLNINIELIEFMHAWYFLYHASQAVQGHVIR